MWCCFFQWLQSHHACHLEHENVNAFLVSLIPCEHIWIDSVVTKYSSSLTCCFFFFFLWAGLISTGWTQMQMKMRRVLKEHQRTVCVYISFQICTNRQRYHNKESITYLCVAKKVGFTYKSNVMVNYLLSSLISSKLKPW